MAPEPRPLQVPGDYYSREEESLFRRELENTLIDVASRIDRVETGISSLSGSSTRRISLHLVPVGQVEVG